MKKTNERSADVITCEGCYGPRKIGQHCTTCTPDRKPKKNDKE